MYSSRRIDPRQAAPYATVCLRCRRSGILVEAIEGATKLTGIPEHPSKPRRVGSFGAANSILDFTNPDQRENAASGGDIRTSLGGDDPGRAQGPCDRVAKAVVWRR